MFRSFDSGRPAAQTRGIPAAGLGGLRRYSNEEAPKKDEELSENEKKLTTEIEGLKKETESLNEKVKQLDVSYGFPVSLRIENNFVAIDSG